MSTGRAPGPLTRLARWHGLVRSPLRRTTDRIEAAVTAVVVTAAQLRHATFFEHRVMLGTTALARWPLPDGQQRSAPLWVGADRHAGDRVPIWIDQHGNRTDPPETPGFLIANVLGIGIDLVVGGWVLLGALWWAVCRVLGRINAAWWGCVVGPHRARVEPSKQ